jgi:hypothetical protein
VARWTAGVGDQVLAAIATEQAAIAAEVTRADGKYVATAGLDAATAPLVTGNGTTATALRAAYVPKWKASTAYAAGEPVINPSGQTVTANAAFTSGASYSASNWTVVSGGGTSVAITDNGTYATLTVG